MMTKTKLGEEPYLVHKRSLKKWTTQNVSEIDVVAFFFCAVTLVALICNAFIAAHDLNVSFVNTTQILSSAELELA